MSNDKLNAVAIEAMRLQNGYARAIDTRDWDYFRTLFSADVVAEYPQMDRTEGIEVWLGVFIPFHDTCTWIQHVMTTHVVGEDADGIWATCYGEVQWIYRDQPEVVQRSRTLYRDRLLEREGIWVIVRRKVDLLLNQPNVPIPEGLSYLESVLDLKDVT